MRHSHAGGNPGDADRTMTNVQTENRVWIPDFSGMTVPNKRPIGTLDRRLEPVPLRCLLVGVRHSQHRAVAQLRADELKSNRQVL